MSTRASRAAAVAAGLLVMALLLVLYRHLQIEYLHQRFSRDSTAADLTWTFVGGLLVCGTAAGARRLWKRATPSLLQVVSGVGAYVFAWRYWPRLDCPCTHGAVFLRSAPTRTWGTDAALITAAFLGGIAVMLLLLRRSRA